jgi:hypothetical protein
MKKLILTLLITLSSLVSFSQESLFGRAYEFHLGEITYDDEIRWIQKPTFVDILIQFNDREVIVFSEEHQVYQIIKEMGRKDDTVMWKALDKRGSTCWLFLTTLDEADAALTIRYSDYAWMYICREQ